MGQLTGLGNRLITSLPAQFLMLVLLNLFFVLGLLWFLNNQNASRERLLTPILTACIQQANVVHRP